MFSTTIGKVRVESATTCGSFSLVPITSRFLLTLHYLHFDDIVSTVLVHRRHKNCFILTNSLQLNVSVGTLPLPNFCIVLMNASYLCILSRWRAWYSHLWEVQERVYWALWLSGTQARQGLLPGSCWHNFKSQHSTPWKKNSIRGQQCNMGCK